MQDGLYKIEIVSAHGSGRGVMVVRDGHLFGGNAALALAGRYRESGSEIVVEITTLQQHPFQGGVAEVGLANS